jgi:hypothetical protein
MSLFLAKLGGKKGLNKIPGDGWSDRPASHTKDVHMVVLDALSSREMVVN